MGIPTFAEFAIAVYYESLKRELHTKTIYGYRCDERLKTNVKESTRLAYTPLGSGHHLSEEVYLQQIKKKAKAEGKTCHAKTMLSLEKPIKLL